MIKAAQLPGLSLTAVPPGIAPPAKYESLM